MQDEATLGTQANSTRLIVQYWHDEDIPGEVAELIASFPALNPEMHHLVFSETSAEEFIAEHFTPREVAAFRACAVPAMQADYLRYCAVLAFGGIYVDVDMECVAPLSSLLEIAGDGVLFGMPRLPPMFRTPAYEWRERLGPYRAINNNIFAFSSPGHPLLELALAMATRSIETRSAENVALTTGPGIFTSLYLLREAGSLEVYADFVRGGVFEAGVPAFCAMIESRADIERRLQRVRIPSLSDAARWARPPKSKPSYKDAEGHWINVKTSIFRAAPQGRRADLREIEPRHSR
ncbi:MAG: glycosyltransferase [Solirubrobacterales bacterium]